MCVGAPDVTWNRAPPSRAGLDQQRQSSSLGSASSVQPRRPAAADEADADEDL